MREALDQNAGFGRTAIAALLALLVSIVVAAQAGATESTEGQGARASNPARTTAPTEGPVSGGFDPSTPSPPTDESPDPVTPPDDRPAFVEDGQNGSGGVSPDAGVAGSADPLAVTQTAVPNFLIDSFEIPPFLLPIYQACGSEYGVPWQVLASINRIETAFGTNLSVSYAGAQGWMQFMPQTWAAYGVDANGDGKRDPYNPVDGICAAANYLDASGYSEDPYGAIFSYNRADWYVQDVLEGARSYAKIPEELITALTGLTEGARFPVVGDATYEGQVATGTDEGRQVESKSGRTSIEIEAPGGSPAIAVNDGVISEIDPVNGRVVLRDVYGNSYEYSGLGTIARLHPVPRRGGGSSVDATFKAGDNSAPDETTEMGSAKAAADPRRKARPADVKSAETAAGTEISEVAVDPKAADSVDGDPALVAAGERRATQEQIGEVRKSAEAQEGPTNTEDLRGRVYANPLRPQNQNRATVDGQSTAAPVSTSIDGRPGDYVVYGGSGIFKFDPGSTDLMPLREGSKVIAGTVLGRLPETPNASIEFSIRPGTGREEAAPRIDPKPFLDGWRLLAETNIYNARGKNRFADRLGAGGVLLLSKTALQKRVLADPDISLQECDRQDIANGSIDRRVLATLAYLSAKDYDLMITSLYCGRETSITTSGNISNHSRGSAVDIAAINGEIVSAATQGPGSLTDRVAREVLALQGTMAPSEVISLLDYPQPAGFAMSDHDDHLHVGFSSFGDDELPGGYVGATLGAEQWDRLIERLGQIRNPEVPEGVSGSALPAGDGARAGGGQ